MINLGEYNTLTIAREAESGLYLRDEEAAMVLLPGKYIPKGYEIGDTMEVFIMNDSEDRLVATTDKPKILLSEFALLKVTAITAFGAFLDWGMEKDLLVPFREQKDDMIEGRWYVVYMSVDIETNRLYASSKVSRCLQNQFLSVALDDKVEVMIYKKTDLGYSVIINDEHEGLIFENEVFQRLNVGDRVEGYVKNIREDNKIDISLQPAGYDKFISKASEEVYRTIEDNGGSVSVSDKSTPERISDIFKMSKKSFKKAVGDLYKQRKITISEDGIKIV